MELKGQYTKVLTDLLVILNKHNSADYFITNTEELIREIDKFIIKVPLIGRFSAGKSRLLNTYLNQNILEWSDSPTTAVATELKYGIEEKIVLHYSQNEVEEMDITELKTIEENVKDIEYIEIYLNNTKLKELDGIVLVDMPGIDSNNNQHTKAVAKYISNGHYFIAVASPLDAFNSSLLQFIDEFANYSYDSFSFILTRKKSSTELKDTQQKLSELLSDKYSKEIFVGSTEASKLGKDIVDFEKSIEEIQNQKEVIFRAEFENKLNLLFTDIISFIQNKLRGSNLSSEKLDIAIVEIEKLLVKERENFNQRLNDIKRIITDETVSNIVAQTSSAIQANHKQLANVYQSGTIDSYIENIVRPITFNEFSNAIQESEQKLSEKLGSIRNIIDTEMESVLMVENTPTEEKYLKKSQQMATNIVANQIANPLVNKTISKIATVMAKRGLGAAGAMIGTLAGPIGTVVGLVVGEIVSELFTGKKEDNSLETQINSEIIPQVIQNVSQTVRNQASEIYEQIKVEYYNLFEAMEKEKIQNITDLKKEKEKSEQEFEETREEWTTALEEIVVLSEVLNG